MKGKRRDVQNALLLADVAALVLLGEMLVEVILVVEAAVAELAALVSLVRVLVALQVALQLALGEEGLLVRKGGTVLEAHGAEEEPVLLLQVALELADGAIAGAVAHCARVLPELERGLTIVLGLEVDSRELGRGGQRGQVEVGEGLGGVVREDHLGQLGLAPALVVLVQLTSSQAADVADVVVAALANRMDLDGFAASQAHLAIVIFFHGGERARCRCAEGGGGGG